MTESEAPIGEVLSRETSEFEQVSSNRRRSKLLTERFFKGKESNIPEIRVTRVEIEEYRPDPSNFPEPKIAENSFHPLDHLARTLIWSDIIADMLPSEQRNSIDRRVLKIAAVLHDVGRGKGVFANFNPHAHGAIAAALIKDRKKLQELLPNAHTEDLTQEQISNIAYLVENHHQFDYNKAQIRPDMKDALTVLQTADGLDLARGNYLLGRWIHYITDRTNAIDNVLPIVKHTLRVPEARRLRTLASRFATQSQKDVKKKKDRFTAVLDVAQEMGLIKSNVIAYTLAA